MHDTLRTSRSLGRATTTPSRSTVVALSRSASSTKISVSIPQRGASREDAAYAARAAASKSDLQAPTIAYRYRPAVLTVRNLPTTMRRPVLSSLKSGSLINNSAKKSLDTSVGLTDISLAEQGYGQPYEEAQELYSGQAHPPTRSEKKNGSWLVMLWGEVKWVWQTGPSDSPFGRSEPGPAVQQTDQPSSIVPSQPSMAITPHQQATKHSVHSSSRLPSSSHVGTEDSRTKTDFSSSGLPRIGGISHLQRSQSAPTVDDQEQHAHTFSLATTGHSHRPLEGASRVNREGEILRRPSFRAQASTTSTAVADRRRDTTISDATRMSDYFAVHDHKGRLVDSDRIKKYRPTPLKLQKDDAPSVTDSQFSDPRFPDFTGTHREPTGRTGVASAMSMSNYSQPGMTPLQSPVSNIIDQYHYRNNDGSQQSRSASASHEYTYPRAGWVDRHGWITQKPQSSHHCNGWDRDSMSEYSDLYDAAAARARR